MKCKMAFLALTVFFIFLLSGVVSAANSDNNVTPQVQQVVQNQSQINVSTLPDPVNTRTHYNSTDIQPVIDDTNTINGDTISIKGGFTYGPVILNKRLALVWDGTGTKPIIPYLYITSSGSGSTINGLDIEHGSLNSAAGITLNGANNVVIKNCIINGFVNGLYQLNSTGSIIQGNYITKNSFSGIELINSTATINGLNNITGNEGYGIYSQDSTVDIESNTIGGNTANIVNGFSGIVIQYANPSNRVNTIKNNIICYNGFNSYSDLTGNGIILLNALGNNIIQSNAINNNKGDGILMYNSKATITNNQIYNGTNWYGIGLFDSSTASVTGNQICNNWIGIYSKNSDASIKNNTLGNNEEFQIFLDRSTSTGIISNNIYGPHGIHVNAYNQIMQFNRIVTKYCSIENFGAVLDANLNWWGSNNGPDAIKIEGSGTNINSWLVLTVTTQPSTILANGISTVTVDFKHDNKGNIRNEGYLPDGILVNFSDVTLGTINPLSGSTVNGIITATFTAGSIKGIANVKAAVDNQNVSKDISIASSGVPIVVNVTPDQGDFYAPVTVTLSPSGGNSPYKVFYTTDGSTPTTNSLQYREPITFNTTHTLKYFVQDSLGNRSPIYTKQYNIYLATIPTVTATPDQGKFYAPVTVTLSPSGGNSPYKVFYTTDGSTPTTSSLQYRESISFNTTHTLKYFVQDNNGNISQIYTKKYNVYKLVTYKYSVREPVKKRYKSHGKWKYKYVTVRVKKWYKKWYKYKGKWRYKWRYKWVRVKKYTTVHKTRQKWVLT